MFFHKFLYCKTVSFFHHKWEISCEKLNHETVLSLLFIFCIQAVKLTPVNILKKSIIDKSEIDNCFDCADKERGYFVLLFLTEMRRSKINFCTNILVEFKIMVNLTKARL